MICDARMRTSGSGESSASVSAGRAESPRACKRSAAVDLASGSESDREWMRAGMSGWAIAGIDAAAGALAWVPGTDHASVGRASDKATARNRANFDRCMRVWYGG